MIKKQLPRVLGRIVRAALPHVGFDAKVRLAEVILRDCGFGSGGNIASSNEEAVFELITNDAPVLIDVGAHVGEYTARFLARFHDGRAYCFEPVQAHFDLLQEAVRHENRAELLQYALSDFEGEATIYRDAEVSGLASLSKRRLDHLSISMDIEESAKVTTLDAFASQRGLDHVDLLKLDVEGHELKVLQGATELFASHRVEMVQFEFGGCNLDTRTNLQDFYSFMARYGFCMYVITRYGLQRIERYREIYEQYRTTNFAAVYEP